MRNKTYTNLTLHTSTEAGEIKNKAIDGTISMDDDGRTAHFIEDVPNPSKKNPIIYKGTIVRTRMQANGMTRTTFQLRAGTRNAALDRELMMAQDTIAVSRPFYEKHFNITDPDEMEQDEEQGSFEPEPEPEPAKPKKSRSRRKEQISLEAETEGGADE